MNGRSIVIAAIVAAALAGAFALGRASVPDGLLRTERSPDVAVATFDGGALGGEDARPALQVPGRDAAPGRRSAVEQMVRTRLMAIDAERRGLHRDPEFTRRYQEELAGLYLQKVFEQPFQKQLPTEDEVRAFFDKGKAALGRPERVRFAHVAFVAPAGDPAARATKKALAGKALAEAQRTAKDEYAFGRIAMRASEDARSRVAGGELPFLTREEVAARLGPEVAQATFEAAPGRVLPRVVETERGYEVLKVLAHEPAVEARLEEAREPIRARLTADRRRAAFDKFLDELWKRSDVKVDGAAIEKLAASSGAASAAR